MGGEGQVLKRIPRIKFPERHPKTSSSGSASQTQQARSEDTRQKSTLTSDVPAPPQNTAVGGKASLQPRRTPVSDREIEAILVSFDMYVVSFDMYAVHYVGRLLLILPLEEHHEAQMELPFVLEKANGA
ncbi:hypothetical protein PanWU01x14_069390 [Parasponia andersonii]|uniref:Uncharacterized protein n=1 Tax=Parasponia andersonii TaxID=3476 RepID=A0A2P5DFN9_PARAD|nr:hypothetical protein PanWU01x14_069390 [Parasponia andersonii]